MNVWLSSFDVKQLSGVSHVCYNMISLLLSRDQSFSLIVLNDYFTCYICYIYTLNVTELLA